MFNMFSDIEIIENLKTITKELEENRELRMMLHTFINETGKEPVKCECERGLKKLKCGKCRGTGYYLVEKVKE